MRFIDDKEIDSIVKGFESATVAREDWKHAEHMVVGLYYLEHNNFDEALNLMREGILTLLSTGFKVDLVNAMPYHETITVFWLKTLCTISEAGAGKPLKAKIKEALAKFDKDYPFRFYSRELLFSPEARVRYVEPDLA